MPHDFNTQHSEDMVLKKQKDLMLAEGKTLYYSQGN